MLYLIGTACRGEGGDVVQAALGFLQRGLGKLERCSKRLFLCGEWGVQWALLRVQPCLVGWRRLPGRRGKVSGVLCSAWGDRWRVVARGMRVWGGAERAWRFAAEDET